MRIDGVALGTGAHWDTGRNPLSQAFPSGDDQDNELWSKSYDEDGKLRYEYTYTYDSLGVLTGITNTFYHSWNNTKTVTEYDGNWNQISEKEYDANGNLISSK